MPPQRYRVRSVALDTIARKARETGDPVALQALGDIQKALKQVTKENKAAAGEQGSAAILGMGASGTKEVLDWLWEIMRPSYPYLYDLLHMQFPDAVIMAMISSFFIWLGRGRK